MRATLLLLAHASLYSVNAWQCDSIKIGQEHYDLSALDSEHTVELSTKTPLIIEHHTYTINPCSSLKKQKDTPPEEQCPPATLLCMVTSIEKNSKQTVTEVVPYAVNADEEAKEPTVKKLEVADDEPSGIRVDYTGGEAADGTNMKARIDFICDSDTGIGKPVHVATDNSALAKFTWRTKHACSKTKDDGGRKRPDHDSDVPPKRSSSWGFFTWIFLIAFMAIASFLIFTLFLNYNRYGQVGLDLVPAMDSVKDIPYLFKDFASQVVETVKGSGSGRSGYSAV